MFIVTSRKGKGCGKKKVLIIVDKSHSSVHAFMLVFHRIFVPVESDHN